MQRYNLEKEKKYNWITIIMHLEKIFTNIFPPVNV
jgi:hypothetical protein